MTDAERQQLDRLQADHAALAGRVARLEAEVATLEHGPRPHTYTVRPGDTLSGIAARLGVGDWRRLYEANRAVIGPDPNLVRPGQVLDIPG